MAAYLGIDVGSVTTKFAVLDEGDELVAKLYLPTEGKPVAQVQRGLRQIGQGLPAGTEISGVATTGSGRSLAGVMVGADMVKNEITCQALAAVRGRDFVMPDDVKYLAPWVLTHRIHINPQTRLRGRTSEEVVAEIVNEVPVRVVD